ncbi:unnamed protein product [Boreogadus saida]
MSTLVIAFLHETDRNDVFSLIAVLAPIPAVMSVSQCKADDSIQQHLFSESDRLTSTVSSSWFSVGDTVNHAMTAEHKTVS